MTIAKKIGVTVGLLTCAVGFVPLAILSLASGAFSPRSKVDIPLTLVPSVLLGDGLLLPLFNGYAFTVLRRAMTLSLHRGGWRVLATAAAVALLLSTVINVSLHRVWTGNGKTGYIALKPGKMSLAGKWHLVFASTEMAFILWFLFLCFFWSKDKDRIDRRTALKAWRSFILYSALTVGDFAVWHLVIAPESGYSLSDTVALLPLPLASLSYVVLARTIPK